MFDLNAMLYLIRIRYMEKIADQENGLDGTHQRSCAFSGMHY